MARDEYIGFRLCNLLLPGDPERVELTTPSGMWEIDREPDFEANKAAIVEEGMCAETYTISIHLPVTDSRARVLDAAFDELLPICLGSSYLVGQAVSPTRGLPMSSINFIAVGGHFPRQRGLHSGFPVVEDAGAFLRGLSAFVANYSSLGRAEKIRLLVHHGLDALSCWSLEDLVLSTTTTLEIVAITAKTVALAAGTRLNTFGDRINYAASRFSLPPLGSDFRDMRNDLVHEGTLSSTRFANKSIQDCAAATAEAMNWIDQYIHHAMGLGSVHVPRFSASKFVALNSFSLEN